MGRRATPPRRRGRARPRAAFPLAPGATLRVPVDRPGDVRVVWTAPDGGTSRALAQWDRDQQPTATATAASTGAP
ncbi:hypothetical protein ACFQRB_14765 [Halobaculum litoreum]|uniref:Uncharacterized protein n=1 Tax=Halobaculum litoreum TaxID=3031998 RepID=A0ABD5XQK0_9EURY